VKSARRSERRDKRMRAKAAQNGGSMEVVSAKEQRELRQKCWKNCSVVMCRAEEQSVVRVQER
jgi:hypothetical protein